MCHTYQLGASCLFDLQFSGFYVEHVFCFDFGSRRAPALFSGCLCPFKRPWRKCFLFIFIDCTPREAERGGTSSQCQQPPPSPEWYQSFCKRDIVNPGLLCAPHFWPHCSLSTSPFLHPWVSFFSLSIIIHSVFSHPTTLMSCSEKPFSDLKLRLAVHLRQYDAFHEPLIVVFLQQNCLKITLYFRVCPYFLRTICS